MAEGLSAGAPCTVCRREKHLFCSGGWFWCGCSNPICLPPLDNQGEQHDDDPAHPS